MYLFWGKLSSRLNWIAFSYCLRHSFVPSSYIFLKPTTFSNSYKIRYWHSTLFVICMMFILFLFFQIKKFHQIAMMTYSIWRHQELPHWQLIQAVKVFNIRCKHALHCHQYFSWKVPKITRGWKNYVNSFCFRSMQQFKISEGHKLFL